MQRRGRWVKALSTGNGWAKEKKLHWDMQQTPSGDCFASRIEVYENNPREVADPKDLMTTVAIKIAD